MSTLSRNTPVPHNVWKTATQAARTDASAQSGFAAVAQDQNNSVVSSQEWKSRTSAWRQSRHDLG